ncbi:MAG: HPr family phosphocarrier protein [Planctomycetota bacterium]
MLGVGFHPTDPVHLQGKALERLSDVQTEAKREVTVPNNEGLHARPVMMFVDLATQHDATVSVRNLTRDTQVVDGKSAMEMMLLEATQGCVLRIEARGADARKAVDALATLVEAGFKPESRQCSS